MTDIKLKSENIFLKLVDLLLVLLIIIGVGFRFGWVNWHEGADLHPDEYGLTNTLTQLSLPKSLDEYFNTRLSPLSPYQKYDQAGNPTNSGPDNRMRWGQWPITLIRAAGEITGNTGYDEIRVLGRRLSALADTLALVLIYLTGRRLYGHRVGFLASTLSALAVMQIQQSHFMSSDNFGVLFSSMAIYAAVRASGVNQTQLLSGLENYQKPIQLRAWYVIFGISLGMATATRINLAVLAGIIVISAAVFLWNPQYKNRINKSAFIWISVNLILAGLAALITFRLIQPMSFRAPTGNTGLFTLHLNSDWVDSMQVASEESTGINAGPPGEQWTNRPILVFPWVNMVVWGMGFPLGLTAWGGIFWSLWRSWRNPGEWIQHVIPLIWAGGYFLFMGTRHVMSIRYFLPIYPAMCLMAAWMLFKLWSSAERRISETTSKGQISLRFGGTALLSAVVLMGTFFWALAFVRAVYLHENTRIQATRWIYDNIPTPLSLLVETQHGLITLPVALPDALHLSTQDVNVILLKPTETGVLKNIKVASLQVVLPPGQDIMSIELLVSEDAGGTMPVARADFTVKAGMNLNLDIPMLPVNQMRTLREGFIYYLITSVPKQAQVTLYRTVLSNESWDESLPVRLNGYDPFGQFYTGETMEVRWSDDENKRDMFLKTLAKAEYIIVPSQRAIWSISRLPENYPMTMEYYRALFGGSLGFDLVASFQAPWQIGELNISDAGGTVAWNQPPKLPLFNNNLLAAEEAFTVYDHAPVWIFHKRPNFDINNAARIIQRPQ
jgi:hypothetical protein